MEALLYTLGKHYGTLRLNLQRSEEASCGHFIILCPTGRHCTLFTPCSMLEASWGFPTPFRRHSNCLKCFISLQECEPQVWLPPLGPGVLPGSGSELPLGCAGTASTAWGGRWEQLCPFSQFHLSVLQVQGRRGQLSLSDQKNAIKEKSGGEQPSSWAGSGCGAAGPSRGSNPLLPAPLTKKTLLLLQFRQLNWTSEVRWYE